MEIDPNDTLLSTRQLKVQSLVLTVGTDCPDWSDTGSTYFRIRSTGGADLRAKIDGIEVGRADDVEFTLYGDNEHRAFIEALQLAASALRDRERRRQDVVDSVGSFTVTAGTESDLAYLRIKNAFNMRMCVKVNGRDFYYVKAVEIALAGNAACNTLAAALEFAIPILSSSDGPSVVISSTSGC